MLPWFARGVSFGAAGYLPLYIVSGSEIWGRTGEQSNPSRVFAGT